MWRLTGLPCLPVSGSGRGHWSLQQARSDRCPDHSMLSTVSPIYRSRRSSRGARSTRQRPPRSPRRVGLAAADGGADSDASLGGSSRLQRRGDLSPAPREKECKWVGGGGGGRGGGQVYEIIGPTAPILQTLLQHSWASCSSTDLTACTTCIDEPRRQHTRQEDILAMLQVASTLPQMPAGWTARKPQSSPARNGKAPGGTQRLHSP